MSFAMQLLIRQGTVAFFQWKLMTFAQPGLLSGFLTLLVDSEKDVYRI